MQCLFSHVGYIIGILVGVFLTIIGVNITEYLKNKNKKVKLTIAFKNEVLTNLQKANFNLSLLDENIEERKGSRHAFYTEAYVQLKLNFILDWTESELANDIFEGFILAEEYNRRINNPELYEKEMGSEKAILRKIKKSMFYIDQNLKNCKIIEDKLKK
jgi:hypothetical protein